MGSLIPFTKMVVRIREKENTDYASIIKKIPERIMWIQHILWKKIIWDNVKKGMVMGNATLIELLLIYAYDKSFLSESEIKRISRELESIWDYHTGDIFEVLDGYIYK